MTEKDRLHSSWSNVLKDAWEAGMAAVEAATIRPMVVGTPRDPAASILGGSDGGFDPDKPIYYVSDGVCGFAWINVKGNRKFLNWLKGAGDSAFPAADALESELAPPRTDSYYRGVSIWVRGFDQSMQKKETFARAFADVLNEKIDGISAYGMSRMD